MKSIKKICNTISLLIHYPVKPSKRVWVLFDIIRQYRNKGITFREYYNMEFEKQPDIFRRTFLGINEEHYYLEKLNPLKFYILSYNKYLTHKVLENRGIRKSSLYCCYQPDGKVVNSSEVATSCEDVCRLLKEKAVDECVVKNPEGYHGSSVFVVKDIIYKEKDAVLVRFDGEQITLSKLLEKQPLIFESLVKQTTQFSDFNTSSVNTVRFMTILNPDGQADIIATFIKIGRAGKCVDNAGSGGNVDAAIDVDTGMIYNVLQFDGWRNAKKTDRHPDNGNQIEGVVINNWSAIKEEVKKFQQAFPYCRAAGWDVAITDDGPVVLEVNDRWDTTGQFFIGRGWRDEIQNCYFKWKKENRNDGILSDRKEKHFSSRQLKRMESK